MKKNIVRKNTPNWCKKKCVWCQRMKWLKDLVYVPKDEILKKGFWACSDESKCPLCVRLKFERNERKARKKKSEK